MEYTESFSQEKIINTIKHVGIDKGRPKSSVSITKKSGTSLGSAISVRQKSSKQRPKTPVVRPMTPYNERGASQHILNFHKALSDYMETKGFSNEFPSPSLLNKVAEEYRTLEINWPEDDEGVVCPCPPSSSKTEDVDVNRMLTMDKRALDIPSAFLKRPLFEVVQYLIEPAENEVEIARALFRWITGQNLDDVTGDSSLTSLPGDYACVLLHRVKMGQIDYSEIFRDMAGYANIECIQIDGVRKTLPEEPSPTVCKLKDWAWVALFLEGHWRLVDCHMGVISWQETQEANNRDFFVGQENVLIGGGDFGSRTQQKSLKYFLNDFYFLTNPEDLILSHFPNKEHWQFLPRPVKYSEFMDMPCLKPQYLFYSIHATEKEKLNIEAKQGKVYFELKTSETIPMKFSYRLRKVSHNGLSQTGKTFEDFVFLENDFRHKLVKILLKLPETGQYVLDLYGKGTDDLPGAQMNHLCSYSIRCFSTDLTFDEYPHNDLMEWGPGAEIKVFGMTPVSHFGGLVNTVDGKADIVFNVSKPMLFDQKLEMKSSSDECFDGYAINRTENGQVIFTVTPPKEGDFCLKIYTKEDNGEINSENVCNYLVHCSNVPDTPILYPKEACGGVGLKKASERLDLKLVSPKSAVIYAPEDGRIALKFTAPRAILLLQKLHYYGHNGHIKELPDNVTQNRQDNDITIRLKFSRQGLYYFTLLGGSNSDHSDFVEVYNAVIHCNWPVRELTPKPRYRVAWKSNYKLLSPKQRYLPAETNVFFSMTIPGAADVVVNTARKTTHLQNKGNDLWESFINTGNSGPGSSLEVTACEDKELRYYSALVVFQILSESEITSKHDKQEENYQKAIQRIQRLKKEGKWRPPPVPNDVKCDDKEDDTLPLIARHNIEAMTSVSDDGVSESETDGLKTVIEKEIRKIRSSPSTGVSEADKTSKSQSKVSSDEVKQPTPTAAAAVSPREGALPTGRRVSGDGSGDTEMRQEASSCTETSSSESDSDSDDDFARWKKNEKLQRNLEDRENLQTESDKVRLTLLKNRLRANIKRKDKLGLKAAVADSQEDNIAVHTVEYAQATRTMSMLSLRDEMKDYIDKKDLNGLKNTISNLERRGFGSDIPYDMAQAKASLRWMQKNTRSPPKTGIIDIPTLAEMNRYHKPPSIVHQVFMAALLLMGVHEGITKRWKRCRKMCVMYGSVGLNKRVRHLKVNQVNPLIAARAREILETYIPEEADSVSPGVGAMYRWIRKVVDIVLVDHDEDVVPAKRKQQRKIFKEERIAKSHNWGPSDVIKKTKNKSVHQKK